MQSIKCSQCGLVNFAEALACKRCNNQLQNYSQTDYQTDYQAHGTFNQPPQSSYPSPSPYQSPNPYQNQAEAEASGAAVRKMVVGALFAVGGTIATVLSYSAASGGGKYFVFWGAILFGAIDFLRGLSAYVSGKA